MSPARIGRSGTTSRDANTPAPTSRRDASRVDATTAAHRRGHASTSGRASLPVNGRIRSVQPNGVSHSSHLVPGPESAIMRRTNATPNAPSPTPVASAPRTAELRRDRADAHEHCGREYDARAVQDGLADPEADIRVLRPASRVITVVPAKSTPTAAPSARSVAAVARDARVLPASTSCQRPVSSSPRNSRVADEESPDRADRREEDEALVDGVAADRVDRRLPDRAGPRSPCRRSCSPPAADGSPRSGSCSRTTAPTPRSSRRRRAPRPWRDPHLLERRRPMARSTRPVTARAAGAALFDHAPDVIAHVRARVRVAVVRDEQLLERGLARRQPVDAGRGERPQERLHRARHVALERVAVDDDVAHAGDPDRSGGGPSSSARTRSAASRATRSSCPVSMIRPARSIATRSHTASTSLKMCDDSNTV